MTAAVSRSRPVLYLVPDARRRGRVAPPRVPGTVSTLASAFTARVLGTLFASAAAEVAEAMALRAPARLRRGRPEVWAAAIAFLLAEQARLFEYDCCSTPTSLARELGVTLPTLRRRAAEVRAALHPLRIELPDPEEE